MKTIAAEGSLLENPKYNIARANFSQIDSHQINTRLTNTQNTILHVQIFHRLINTAAEIEVYKRKHSAGSLTPQHRTIVIG
jgi:hypothetical protein